MMTHYAFGWRRLAPLFSVRAFRHVTRPVEINPWMDGTGRGTFPNTVRQVQRAIESARSLKETSAKAIERSTGISLAVEKYDAIDGKKPDSQEGKIEKDGQSSVKIFHKNSQSLDFIETATVDLALTDPPYFDNIAYSELSDFFLPWLQLFNLARPDGQGVDGFQENLAAKGRGAAAFLKFQRSLGLCFSEIARVLKPDGRLVFTYQHKTAGAWYALASALNGTGLRVIQVFPLLGDSNIGLHKHEGSSKWDAVFVAVKGAPTRKSPDLSLSVSIKRSAKNHYMKWVRRLGKQTVCAFRDADKQNFYRACLVASAVGLFSELKAHGPEQPLDDLLDENLPQE
jgi:putative DNA methylase